MLPSYPVPVVLTVAGQLEEHVPSSFSGFPTPASLLQSPQWSAAALNAISPVLVSL